MGVSHARASCHLCFVCGHYVALDAHDPMRGAACVVVQVLDGCRSGQSRRRAGLWLSAAISWLCLLRSCGLWWWYPARVALWRVRGARSP